jgi:hypothetical protein
MPLSDSVIRQAKPAVKARKLFDGRGLYLIVTSAGGKWWRLKYRFAGKEKLMSLGVYPEVGLKEARERREAARKALAAGIDPGAERKAAKAAAIAAERPGYLRTRRRLPAAWSATFSPGWVASR